MTARPITALVLLLAVAPTCVAGTENSSARPDSGAFFAVTSPRDGYGLVPDASALREEVVEPLFAFVFTLVEADSLGTWSAADLLAFAAAYGQESAFPVAANLESITRESLAGDAVLDARGVQCRRRWVVRLRPALAEFPLPFSILGYHPGTLSIATPLVLNEWQLGSRSVYVTVEGATRKYEASAVTIWQVADGWLVLDVDGWLDKLLGRGADDAATLTFTACRLESELIGVGNSVGRNGRRIYGELNFRSGEIENHGRPQARGLAQYSRGWSRLADPDGRATWKAYEDR